jgi:hypothetical protein
LSPSQTNCRSDKLRVAYANFFVALANPKFLAFSLQHSETRASNAKESTMRKGRQEAKTGGLYPYRTLGGHRHYRYPGELALTLPWSSKAEGPPGVLP